MAKVEVGVLYYPKLSIEPIVKSGVDTAQFRSFLKETSGLEFSGFDNSYITTSITGINGHVHHSTKVNNEIT